MSEQVLSCDIVIIGAGTAGLEAYKVASKSGKSCILVESGPLGTGVKRTGDIPVSALLAAGKINHAFVDLERYGLKAESDLCVDVRGVLDVVRNIRTKETSDILSFIYQINEKHRLIGKAHFIDPHRLMVNESHIVEFKTAIIATGAVPIVPFELNQYLKDGGIYTINDIFEIDHFPKSMAIFGTTHEGLQLAQALSYLGVKVVLFGSRRIWELTDEAVIDVAVDIFKERFNLVLDSYTTAFEKNDNRFGIYYLESNNYENFLSVETVLSATKRYPKIDGLNLRQIGVRLNRQGCIDTNEKTKQTSLDHIFAIGDVASLYMRVYQARRDGHCAALNAINYPNVTEFDEDLNLSVLYTDPELAVVGLTYDLVTKRAHEGKPFVSCEVRCNTGRFRASHQDGGILRMYCDEKTHQILGAELCMHSAGHLAQFLALAIKQKMTVDQLSVMVYFSPGYTEVIKQACDYACRILARKEKQTS